MFEPCCDKYCAEGNQRDNYSDSQIASPAFRSAKLVFSDVSTAVLYQDKKRATTFGVDEIYNAAPKVSAARAPSQIYDSSAHDEKRGNTKQRHHFHSEGQPLMICGGKGCIIIGVTQPWAD